MHSEIFNNRIAQIKRGLSKCVSRGEYRYADNLYKVSQKDNIFKRNMTVGCELAWKTGERNGS